MPAISVIIPTYNRASYICAAIDSVLAQTFNDYEIIVVDDGSTDDTLERLAVYKDQRIKVKHQKNLGQGFARNTGLSVASGEYIAFLDSDDVWMPGKLDLQYGQLVQSKNCYWSYTNAFAFQYSTDNKLYRINERMRLHFGSIPSELIKRNFITTSTVMVKKVCFDSVGIFANFAKAEDWEVWLRLASKFDVCVSSEALVGYRIHEKMVTKGKTPYSIHVSHLKVLDRAIHFAPHLYGELYNEAVSIQYKNTAKRFLSDCKPMRARCMLRKAIALDQWSMQYCIFWSITFFGSPGLAIVKKLYKLFVGTVGLILNCRRKRM